MNINEQCSGQLSGFIEVLKDNLQKAPVLHSDETGFYYESKRNWLHVAATEFLTYCAVKSLQMALQNTEPMAVKGCVHHSHRGIQYCCDAYTERLSKEGIEISMTEQSDPLENAIAERINKTIKEEFTDQKELSFTTIEAAKTDIKKFIDFYNNQRPHRSIDWLTPNQAYQREGELKRHWKMYMKKAKGDL